MAELNECNFQSLPSYIPGVSATYGFSPTISLSAGTMRDLKGSHPSRGIIAKRGEQGLAAEREQQHEEDYKGLAVAPIHQLPSSSSLSHLPYLFRTKFDGEIDISLTGFRSSGRIWFT